MKYQVMGFAADHVLTWEEAKEAAQKDTRIPKGDVPTAAVVALIMSLPSDVEVSLSVMFQALIGATGSMFSLAPEDSFKGGLDVFVQDVRAIYDSNAGARESLGKSN